ncbi:MAG: 50S ribosomal protein L3 [Candidatus Methylarchaceae archaeon HK01B]|nr:50S ribosomal protein L3 [Candidatus Methylarchaceae archaeon HK01M]MCP8311958.1 50S ribosomal protein L3 [Candidatus Methylarchaceae archaeon HK02M1]MCP8318675.1 50S ribosomal protein L3 [Candidatus Methylarchaceae archaeon HK01B]
MGHRKKSAPRRGSLAYRPRGRAASIVPTVKTWPEISVDKPSLLGFAGFKSGLIHIITMDDREKTPNFGKPVFNAATVIATPSIFIHGIRVYGRDHDGLFVLGDAKDLSEKMGKRLKVAEKALKRIEGILDKVVKMSAIVEVYPKGAGLSQKKPIIFEIGVGGGDMKSRFEYLKGIMSKEVKINEIIKPGTYIDIIGITKGKGFEGPVTRLGIKRKSHKSRKSVRAVATLGPWHPASVMYTVPRAGQRGYHQRVEYNKKVMVVSNSEEEEITPKSGFPHFGVVDGDYVIVKGSVPGPAKRLIKLRLPLRPPKVKIQPPKILEISVRR